MQNSQRNRNHEALSSFRTSGHFWPFGFPDKWVLMMLKATGVANVRNLGDVRWLATEDGTKGKGTGRHIAAFILLPK